MLAKELCFQQVIHLSYRNHFLDEASPIELRARLVYLIRALKIDTITTFSPWGHWEENPDHCYNGQAVEAARWMAGMSKDYPEHIACGRNQQPWSQGPHYWTMRPKKRLQHAVDIEPYLEEKRLMSANKSQAERVCSNRRRLKERLAREGKRLPELGEDDETADRHIRLFGLTEYEQLGAPYNLQYAEYFYYMPPGGTFTGSMSRANVDAYLAQDAVDL